MKIIQGDLLEQKGYLVQQCNCVTRRPHGLSRSFVGRFGKIADVYGEREGKNNRASNYETPGTVKIVKLNDEQTMVALMGQIAPGRPGKFNDVYEVDLEHDDEKMRLSYFSQGLQNLLEKIDDTTIPVYFPCKIGCGLAGGDWLKYLSAIKEFAHRYKGDVIIVQKT